MAMGYETSPNCKYVGKSTEFDEFSESFYPIQTCSHEKWNSETNFLYHLGFCPYTNKGEYLCDLFTKEEE